MRTPHRLLLLQRQQMNQGRLCRQQSALGWAMPGSPQLLTSCSWKPQLGTPGLCSTDAVIVDCAAAGWLAGHSRLASTRAVPNAGPGGLGATSARWLSLALALGGKVTST